MSGSMPMVLSAVGVAAVVATAAAAGATHSNKGQGGIASAVIPSAVVIDAASGETFTPGSDPGPRAGLHDRPPRGMVEGPASNRRRRASAHPHRERQHDRQG